VHHLDKKATTSGFEHLLQTSDRFEIGSLQAEVSGQTPFYTMETAG